MTPDAQRAARAFNDKRVVVKWFYGHPMLIGGTDEVNEIFKWLGLETGDYEIHEIDKD